MIRENFIPTEREAEERATQLLWEHRTVEEGMTTTERKPRDKDGNTIFGFSITDNETGATVYGYSFNETYNIVYLNAEEADPCHRTYIFRGLKPDEVMFGLSIGSVIFRPVEEIKPEDAMKLSSIKKVNAFYGDEEEEDKTEDYTLENAFTLCEYEQEKPDLYCLLYIVPEKLAKLTGIPIKDIPSYVAGIGKLLNVELDSDKMEAVTANYLCETAILFIRYATYEFVRTESYEHLQRILTTHKEFMLPEQWYKYSGLKLDSLIYTPDSSGTSVDVYIMNVYLSQEMGNKVGGATRLKDIAEYIGAPVGLLMKAATLPRGVFKLS